MGPDLWKQAIFQERREGRFLVFSERGFEDHEYLVEGLSAWPRHSQNKIYFLSKPEKYVMFTDPQVRMSSTRMFVFLPQSLSLTKVPLFSPWSCSTCGKQRASMALTSRPNYWSRSVLFCYWDCVSNGISEHVADVVKSCWTTVERYTFQIRLIMIPFLLYPYTFCRRRISKALLWSSLTWRGCCTSRKTAKKFGGRATLCSGHPASTTYPKGRPRLDGSVFEQWTRPAACCLRSSATLLILVTSVGIFVWKNKDVRKCKYWSVAERWVNGRWVG